MPGMSDLLIMLLGMFACTMVCFANPCPPERWACVKASRPKPQSVPKSTRGSAPLPELEPASVPSFADALAPVIS